MTTNWFWLLGTSTNSLPISMMLRSSCLRSRIPTDLLLLSKRVSEPHREVLPEGRNIAFRP